MSMLGVYFGPKVIRLVTSKGKSILSDASIPSDLLVSSDLEDKVPEEIKLVALFKEELRKNNISARGAVICLAGKDMIVRSFQMPALPKNEIDQAVRFETKKYIPLKIEDLVLDYQVVFDKSTQKNTVLLAAVRREILDKYSSLFSQLGITVDCVEYAAFSMLRALELSGRKEKGVAALVGIDLREGDEINFIVLENGFPVFSRDINLGGAIPAAMVPEETADSGMLIEKLKTEIRISVDYYNRMAPGKNIEKILFLAAADYQAQVEAFMKELGFDCAFLDAGRILGKPAGFSLSLVKGFSASLFKTVKTSLKVDLLAAKAKAIAVKVPVLLSTKELLAGLKVDKKFVALGLLICALAFGFGLYKAVPIKESLRRITSQRPLVRGVDVQANVEELEAMKSSYEDKVAQLKNIFDKQLYMTLVLDAIPRIIPTGVWLENIDYGDTEAGKELILRGRACLDDPNKEFELVGTFLKSLREDSAFNRYFKYLEIVSLDTLSGMPEVTQFTIICTNKAAVVSAAKEER